jgi:Skp family chaperone for outer membrane proteins
VTHAPDVLLSDEFADFSGKVTALHEKKKELKAEFKKLFEKHKANIRAIDEEAESLQNDFNAWAAPGSTVVSSVEDKKAAPKQPSTKPK